MEITMLGTGNALVTNVITPVLFSTKAPNPFSLTAEVETAF